MARQAFVRDSDDEGDDSDGSASGQRSREVSPSNKPCIVAMSTTASKSTGSTGEGRGRINLTELTERPERLHRQIWEAHECLLPPDDLDELSHEAQMPPMKRRKTTNDLEPTEACVPYTTLERRMTSNVSTHYSNSGGKNSDARPIKMDEPVAFTPSRRDYLNDGERDVARDDVQVTWGLPASLQTDFAQHDPQSMFPDQSSTIPDNTCTQARMLEEAKSWNVSAMNGTVHFGEDPISKSSIPWSDYLHTSAVSRLCLLSHRKLRRVQKELHNSEVHAADNQQTSISNLVESTFTSSKLGLTPSSQQRAGDLDSEQNSDDRPAAIDTTDADVSMMSAPADEPLGRYDDQTVQLDPVEAPKGKLKRIKRNQDHIEDDGRAALVDIEANFVTGPLRRKQADTDQFEYTTSGSQHSAKMSSLQSDFVHSDELAMLPPKEHYKPRASRSRSERAIPDEPIDYSVTVEKAAKNRSKRRKTVAASNGIDSPASSQNIETLCAMGFSPEKAKLALEQNNNLLDLAIEWLFKNSSPVAQKAARTPVPFENDDGAQKTSAETGDWAVQKQEESKERCSQDEMAAEAVDLIDNPGKGHQRPLLPESGLKAKQKETEPSAVEIPVEETPPAVTFEEPVKLRKARDAEPFISRKKAAPKAKRSKTVPVQIIESDSDEEEPVPEPVVSKKKGRGRPRKSDQQQQGEREYPMKNVSVEVSVTKSSRIATQKDAPQAVDEALTKEADDTPPKRGRGRPRKSLASTVNDKPEEPTASVQQEMAEQEEADIKDTVTEATTTPSLKSQKAAADSNDTPTKTPMPNQTKGDDTTPTRPSAAPPDKENALPSSTPPDTKKRASSTAGSHSPLSKGKVPYRVGLSKRARIAPLLRVMRK